MIGTLNGVYMFVNLHAISVYFSLVAAPVLCDWHPQWSVHVCELTCYQCLFLSCCSSRSLWLAPSMESTCLQAHMLSVFISLLLQLPFSVIGTLNGVYMFVNSHAISVYFSLVAAPVLCGWHPQWSLHVCKLTCYQCLFLSCCSSRSL